MTGRRNEEPIELMHEDFQVHVDSDWVGDLLGRMNTTGVVVRRCIEECVSMTSENKITFETNCETNEYFHLFINTEMLVIAARTHVDYVECTSMVFHSSVKSCKNVGTREMGSRVQCNEFGDETNQRLVEPGMSAKRVDTSMRLVGDDFCVAARQKQMQTSASYQCGKSWFVNVMTDWKSNSSCIHRGKKRCPGMISSIQMRVA